MASRRSKDKTPATDNQILKKEPASPLDIVNQFTRLGTIPKPNYSSVLASIYDPYALTNVHQPVQTVFPRNPNASQHVKKRYVQNLFSVDNLLLVIFLHNFTGFLSTAKRMCNTILKFYDMRIQSLSKP